MTTPKTPVVFIHGLWLHATSWQPWIDFFQEAGYEATAPGWPGVPDTVAEAREHPEPFYGAHALVSATTGMMRALLAS